MKPSWLFVGALAAAIMAATVPVLLSLSDEAAAQSSRKMGSCYDAKTGKPYKC